MRIEISQGMPGRLEALLLREGSEINTIHLSVEGGDADPLLFVFVTEEKISETTEAFRKAGEFWLLPARPVSARVCCSHRSLRTPGPRTT